MKGYWNREQETASALDADGWYHSGDPPTPTPTGISSSSTA
jgi:long-chain acyl-CoA synthetase